MLCPVLLHEDFEFCHGGSCTVPCYSSSVDNTISCGRSAALPGMEHRSEGLQVGAVLLLLAAQTLDVAITIVRTICPYACEVSEGVLSRDHAGHAIEPRVRRCNMPTALDSPGNLQCSPSLPLGPRPGSCSRVQCFKFTVRLGLGGTRKPYRSCRAISTTTPGLGP